MQAIANVGRATIQAVGELGGMVGMLRLTASEIRERLGARRAPVTKADFFQQAYRVGIGSLSMVVLLSFFVGLTMALLTGYQLRVFGMVSLVPPVVSVSFTREMGPLFTGIVMASRIGAAYTAELGAMKTGGEIDALEVMGLGAHRFLAAPRLLAIFAMTPCLAVVASIAGILGAAGISSFLLNINSGFFFDQVMTNFLVKDAVAGMAKSTLFGALIGLIACYKGFSVEGGAMGVGVATTSCVVTAISAVIVADSLCNIFIISFFP